MNYYRFTYYFPHIKPVSEKAHPCITVIGKKHREVPGMVSMGLIVGVPVASRSLKRVLWVSHPACAELVQVKPVGANRVLSVHSRLVARQPGNLHPYLATTRDIPKKYDAFYLRCHRTTPYIGHRCPVLAFPSVQKNHLP
jgi:hypothetical protein